MCFKNRAHAGGRNCGVADLAVHGLHSRPYLVQIGRNLDVHRLGLSILGVINENLPELFIHDAAGTCAGVTDVMAGVFDELRDSLCRGIVADRSHRPVTVGEKVDLVGDPHRINVVGVRTRNLLGAQVAEVGYPQVARFPASIPFPGHKALGSPAKLAAVKRGIGQALTIR